ncbi:Non-specific lipid-transfer protein [Homalodisca vitripennis]|nr:Non-specific lipid-transfer protein [Homalodisca vitripennis]
MWEEYSRNPNTVLDWQLQFRDFMFDLKDTSGDGAIDEEEFAMICSSYNVPEAERSRCLPQVFSCKFADLWVEYFDSKSPDRPRKLHFQIYQVGKDQWDLRNHTGKVWGAVGRIIRLGGSIRPRELHLRSYQVRIGSYLVREPISYNRRRYVGTHRAGKRWLPTSLLQVLLLGNLPQSVTSSYI